MTTQVSNDMLGNDAREFVIALRGPAANGTYPVMLNPPFTFDILRADFQCDTGTIKAKFTIDGTDVEFDGGDETLELSNTADSENVASAGSVGVGDTLLMVLFDALDSPVLVAIDLFCRRT